MNTLTKETIQKIQDIMKTGEHIHHQTKKTVISRPVLYQVFRYYCEQKGIMNRSFKARHFRHKDKCSPNPNNRGTFYSDIPMEHGQVVTALRYGAQQGYLEMLSSSEKKKHMIRYRFTDKDGG